MGHNSSQVKTHYISLRPLTKGTTVASGWLVLYDHQDKKNWSEVILSKKYRGACGLGL